MNDFKKTLSSEATSLRGIIESHVRTQMGLTKPIRDTGVQTMTYNRLYQEIENEVTSSIQKRESAKAEELFEVKEERLYKEIGILEEKMLKMKVKTMELQHKVTMTTEEGFKENLLKRINAFFMGKLSKKQRPILDEFNEKILQMANPLSYSME